ncbi:hypothetical protein A2635_00065 [Candidatus Peribacteria bacterium RIFCSPHIGHO2_01_FULL_51_9]|nr:MAG: hypothetical protein A2635_00065 [Candidatus Peribacteria bacterium RIFCSPHIGHO2_01_FULL_51_9]
MSPKEKPKEKLPAPKESHSLIESIEAERSIDSLTVIEQSQLRQVRKWLNESPAGKAIKEAATNKNHPYHEAEKAYLQGIERVLEKIQKKFDEQRIGTIRILEVLTEDEARTFLEVLYSARQFDGGQGGVGSPPETTPEGAAFGEVMRRMTWFQYDVRDEFIPGDSRRPKDYQQEVATLIQKLATNERVTLFDFHVLASQDRLLLRQNNETGRNTLYADFIFRVTNSKTGLYYEPRYVNALRLIVGLVEKHIPALRKMAEHRGANISRDEWMRQIKAYEMLRGLSATGELTNDYVDPMVDVGKQHMIALAKAYGSLSPREVLTGSAEVTMALWNELKTRVEAMHLSSRMADRILAPLVSKEDVPALDAGLETQQRFQKEGAGFLEFVAQNGEQPLAVFRNAIRDGGSDVVLLRNLTPLQKKMLAGLCARFTGEQNEKKVVDQMMDALRFFEDESTASTRGAVRQLFEDKIGKGEMKLQDVLLLHYLADEGVQGKGIPLALKCMQLIDRYAADDEQVRLLSIPRQHACFNRLVSAALSSASQADIRKLVDGFDLPPEMKRELLNVMYYNRDELWKSWEDAKAHLVRGHLEKYWPWYLGGGGGLLGISIGFRMWVGRRCRRAFEQFENATPHEIEQRYHLSPGMVRALEPQIREAQETIGRIHREIDRVITPSFQRTHWIGSRAWQSHITNPWTRMLKGVLPAINRIERVLHGASQLERKMYDLNARARNTEARLASDRRAVRERQIQEAEFAQIQEDARALGLEVTGRLGVEELRVSGSPPSRQFPERMTNAQKALYERGLRDVDLFQTDLGKLRKVMFDLKITITNAATMDAQTLKKALETEINIKLGRR